jgi:hypothetical protein
MSPGRNDWPGGTAPFGFCIADPAILMSPERSAHPGVALGILVSARRSRSASQSIRARASTTTMKILRNVYMTIANTTASHYRAAPFSRLMRALPHRLDFLRHEPIAAAFHTAAFDIFLMSEVAQPCSGVAIRGPIVAHESVDHNVELGLTPIVAFAWGAHRATPAGSMVPRRAEGSD